jgi:hypothetical protein
MSRTWSRLDPEPVSPAQSSTPRQRIAAECARNGTERLTAACVALLEDRPGEVSDDLILVLGGEHGRNVLDGADGGKAGYWPRVWAARALLHQWDPVATAAITDATYDEAWRVREMAAKVIAAHRVGDALDAVAALRTDPVERVRAAASRAVTLLTATGA